MRFFISYFDNVKAVAGFYLSRKGLWANNFYKTITFYGSRLLIAYGCSYNPSGAKAGRVIFSPSILSHFFGEKGCNPPPGENVSSPT